MRRRLAALLVLALAAPTARADPPTRVRVGVLNDRSGTYADMAGEGSVVAARMAVEDFDAARKGFAVEVLSADHQNKPDVGAAIARAWYDREGVDAVLDVPTSSVALAVSGVTREKNRVLVVSTAGTADLTGPQCSPNTVHWTYDTVAQANGTGAAVVRRGGDAWFFLTANYAFGAALERDARTVIEANGGRVLGSIRTPFPSADFSSYLLTAQGSGAEVIGLANAGSDTVNAVKQAAEFGITGNGGARLAALLIFSTDVAALGLPTAQGLLLTEAFYWDLNEGTRAFSKRFAERHRGRMPTSNQAGVYAGLLHYLKAVEALRDAGRADAIRDGAAIVARMKAMPTDDPLFGRGRIRPDGRKIHDMYLFEVKSPSESSGPLDLYKLLETIPGDQVFRPLEAGGCPLVTGSAP